MLRTPAAQTLRRGAVNRYSVASAVLAYEPSLPFPQTGHFIPGYMILIISILINEHMSITSVVFYHIITAPCSERHYISKPISSAAVIIRPLEDICDMRYN